MHKDKNSQTKTFAVATLGCKVNQADSEAISEQMSAAGFEQREFNEAADIYIVNTCTVTHLGDRSSRLMISQAHRRQPEALLIVTGCYAERDPDGVAALPGVDLVIGNQLKDALVETIHAHQQASLPLAAREAGESAARAGAVFAVYSAAPAHAEVLMHVDSPNYDSFQPVSGGPGALLLPMLARAEQHIGSDSVLEIDLHEPEPQPENPERGVLVTDSAAPGLADHARLHTRTRVQMKVQDGCDNRCTYCIVPYVRGGSRSRAIPAVVEHVRRKVRAGFQEIVLTGIHLGDYHPEGESQRDLGDLLAALLDQTEIRRIRVSSLEPEDFRLEWLQIWQDARMCRHFHLPMQSGSDAILRRMARRYLSARYREIVLSAQRIIPGVAISTDIITGFPGESDEDFEQTYQLASELHFAKAHVFRFSPRQGTPAARMKGQIRDEIKKARSERLLALNESDARAFRQRFLRTEVDVLIEGSKHDRWEGLTDNYLRVELADVSANALPYLQNRLVRARLHGLAGDGLAGTLLAPSGYSG
ncbi:MAG TPA: tRNA (N(6)-L-threonylcarbamoyladenosine(37)-C(2))-methylthiotransferase MtaB [Ktedonobacteraceae bacterium]